MLLSLSDTKYDQGHAIIYLPHESPSGVAFVEHSFSPITTMAAAYFPSLQGGKLGARKTRFPITLPSVRPTRPVQAVRPLYPYQFLDWR